MMTNAEIVYLFIGSLIAASLVVLLWLWFYVKHRIRKIEKEECDN
jgi:peptidoglycan biosynthesis protein MviN/MurJ (putative lipid II flippase)